MDPAAEDEFDIVEAVDEQISEPDDAMGNGNEQHMLLDHTTGQFVEGV